MDIARPDLARKKRLRHSLYSVSALIAIALVTVGVSRLEPAAPRVDRDTIYLDTVQRGPMVRQVRGTGTLVPEQIGQSAAVDTRNGVIAGHVTRIDPAVENGTVTVDVALDGELPRGARPDLTVDGTIELERMDDVLFVGRPVFGQEENVVSLFRVDEDGMHASRTRVRLGERRSTRSRCWRG